MSTLLFWRSVAIKRKKSKIIVLVIAALLPILLAAFRDTSVGGDVLYYVVPYFNNAVASKSFITYTTFHASKDILYDLLNYIVTRFSDNIFWFFLVYESIIISCVFLGSINLSKIEKPWLTLISFYFIFYQFTLTTVRQNIALSICFLAISVLIKHGITRKTILLAFFLNIIAVGFHSSAVVFALLISLFIFIHKKKPKTFFLLLIVSTITIILLLSLPTVLSGYLKIITSFNSKYSGTAYFTFGGDTTSGYTTLVLFGSGVFITLFFVQRRKGIDEFNRQTDKWVMCLSLIHVLMFIFIGGFGFIARMAYYFQYFWIIGLPRIELLFKKDPRIRLICKLCFFAILVIFWWYYFIHGGVTLTYPYIVGHYF